MPYEEINSITIHYKIAGKGYPVVLIHGLSDDLEYWKYLNDYLKDYFKVISVDLRGHGKSEEGEVEYTTQLLAEDVVKLLKKINIEKTNIVGFSLGGHISLEIITKYPEIINKVILISTSARITPDMEEDFNRLEESSDKGFVKFFDCIIDHILPEDILNESKEELEIQKFKLAKIRNINGIHKAAKSCKSYDVYDNLNKINNEVLIIYGEDDTIISKTAINELVNNIDNSKLITLKNTKHNVLIERNYDYLKELIKDFLYEN
ncbi:alpha/beta fold hydrolase [uncultured Methanobrevibacter sp.]|uniref:alpha/beta fold hydrolase n=1 Tax=uncultured Methanobrevibacter sp. TaxID=253161 RepID=UPI0025D85F33|nr:alpha/beta hydrolase [uncultured Methanobrevibacter sp.]